MHGHSYRLQVLVCGDPDAATGMVVDFFDIEEAVGVVINSVHDTCLNERLENPTAEAIVAWLWLQIQPALPQLAELRLFETEACHVTYRGEPVAAALLTPGSGGPYPGTAPDA
jgi:6-pyruvoyltetrahydropterin/6-carboxytetrahydropterin synthase